VNQTVYANTDVWRHINVLTVCHSANSNGHINDVTLHHAWLGLSWVMVILSWC